MKDNNTLKIENNNYKSKLSPGDVVRLKSGGPTMTVVEAFPKDMSCDVYWCDNNGQPFMDRLREVVLVKEEK